LCGGYDAELSRPLIAKKMYPSIACCSENK